ncbi:MAG TPA: ABC transporter ATP-binding protein [Chitinophagaceae bacterium]
MKQILINTWTVLEQKERKQFIWLVMAGVIISILDILALVSLLWIINFYIQPANKAVDFLPAWLANKDSITLIAVFFVLFGIKNIVAYLIAKAHYHFSGNVAIRISQNNLSHYQRSAYSEFVNIDSSTLIRRIALQPFEFAQHVLSGMQQIITQVFLIGITIIAIVIFDFRIFLLLLLILLPPVVVVFYFIKKRLAATKKQLRESNERSYQYLLDALKGYVEANIYQRNDFFLQRFIAYRRQFSSHLFHSLSLQNLPSRVIEIFAVLGLFILILIAKTSGNNDSSTLITIGAFMAAAYKIIPGIVKVINLAGQVKAYEFAADELISSEAKQNSSSDDVPVSINTAGFKNISFKYAESTVLKNVSFSVSKGDFLGISGVSGKGKTTILNLLLGFLEPVAGEIHINNQITTGKDRQQYWPAIAYVRQQSFFIYDNILRNIILQEDEPGKERLDRALKISGLDSVLSTFPEGLNKVITENGKNISGGQQQRIAIARALYKNAELIILDEPFNELDEASTFSLLEHFKQLSAEKMIIMITHDKKSLSFCNKTISLDEEG